MSVSITAVSILGILQGGSTGTVPCTCRGRRPPNVYASTQIYSDMRRCYTQQIDERSHFAWALRLDPGQRLCRNPAVWVNVASACRCGAANCSIAEKKKRMLTLVLIYFESYYCIREASFERIEAVPDEPISDHGRISLHCTKFSPTRPRGLVVKVSDIVSTVVKSILTVQSVPLVMVRSPVRSRSWATNSFLRFFGNVLFALAMRVFKTEDVISYSPGGPPFWNTGSVHRDSRHNPHCTNMTQSTPRLPCGPANRFANAENQFIQTEHTHRLFQDSDFPKRKTVTAARACGPMRAPRDGCVYFYPKAPTSALRR